jgi:hypothetical protein
MAPLIALATAALPKLIDLFAGKEKGGLVRETLDNFADFVLNDTRAKEVLLEHAKLEEQKIQNARDHDKASYNLPVVDIARGLVRPLTTIGVFSWYVYARANGIELQEYDWYIIGGVIAFWFGFRPLEQFIKKKG